MTSSGDETGSARDPDTTGGGGWREDAPNPTQERIDREGASERPADVSWEEPAWGDTGGAEDDAEEEAV